MAQDRPHDPAPAAGRQTDKRDPTPKRDAQKPSPKTVKRGFGALRYPNYRFYFYGQLASVIGLWMQSLALSWLVVTTLGGSPVDLGIVNALNFGPSLLFGLYAGVVADRVNKRDLVNVAQTVALILAASQAVLIVTGRSSIDQVFAFALVLGISNAFNNPARQAMTSELVDRSEVMNAVALNSAIFNAGRVVGPSIAGILVAAFGPAICFAINAACYAFAFALFRRIKLKPVAKSTGEPAVQRLREGLAFVRDTRAILIPIVLVGVVATFAMNFNVWLPLLANEEFDIGASGFGLLISALGAGSLIGALNLAYFSDRPRAGRMFALAAALGVTEIVVATMSSIPTPVVFALPAVAAAGFCMSTATATANTIVQTTAPDALRGRVMSVYMTVFSGTVPIGSLITGAMAQTIGTPAAVAIGGAIATVATGGLWLWQKRTHAIRPAGDPEEATAPPDPPSPRRTAPTGDPASVSPRPAPRGAPSYAPPEATED